MEFVDTHCHLQFEAFDNDREAVLSAANQAGVNKIICIGTTLEDSKKAVDFADRYKGIWVAIGWHPHESAKYFTLPQTAWRAMDNLINSPKVVAVGEAGLDYHYDSSEPEQQEIILRFQIEMLALKNKLPIIFHVRDAWKDFWRIVDDYSDINAVIHSFTAGQKQLDKIIEKGWFIGLNGIMTFTKDQAQLAAAKQVPLDKLLLETDAPFLAPVPFRGQTGQPKHVVNTAEFLAKLRGQAVEEIAQATTENAVRLFDLK
jgi:TatD DNase family protein